MIEPKTIADLVSTLGFPIVITFWLLYRDYKWISQLVILEQQEIDLLKTIVKQNSTGEPKAK